MKKVCLILAIFLVLGIGGCTSQPQVEDSEPLSLEILYPQYTTSFDTNMIRVAGTVSDPSSNVTVSYAGTQIEAKTAEDGSFHAWVDLPEGSSNIEVTAVKEEKKATKSVTVTFTPSLAVYLEEISSNVTDKPTNIRGYVTRPEAKVTVKRLRVEVIKGEGFSGYQTTDEVLESVPAEVNREGYFSAEIHFNNGHNSINAEATLGQETDRDSYVFEIMPNGFIMPGRSLGPRFRFGFTQRDVTLKAGETVSFGAGLETDKDISSPGPFTVAFWRIINRSFNGIPIAEEMKGPMPEGLEIIIEPNNFTIWPKAVYSMDIVVRAMEQAVPGDYYFLFEYKGGVGHGGGPFNITVLPGDSPRVSKPRIEGGLSLDILAPQDGIVLEKNLIGLYGKVSDPEAGVTVSYAGKQAEPIFDGKGNFHAFLDLDKGPNTIEVTASKNGKKAIKAVTVTFNPPLAVYLDLIPMGANLTLDGPAAITGYVTRPEAIVTVNGVPAEVSQDGFYSAEVQLEPGLSTLIAEATLGGRSDERRFSFELSPKGRVITKPNPATHGVGQSLVTLKAGEKNTDVLLVIENTLGIPGQFKYAISRVYGLHSKTKLPMPEGLTIYLEPDNFTVWPLTLYRLQVIIETTSQVTPGTYWFLIEDFSEGVGPEAEWLGVMVTS